MLTYVQLWVLILHKSILEPCLQPVYTLQPI